MAVMTILLAVFAPSYARAERWAGWEGGFSIPDVNFHSPFDACEGLCMVSVFHGNAIMDNMEDLLLLDPKFPWDYDYGERKIVGASFARTLATWGSWGRMDAELGLAKRYVIDDEWEGWAALYFHWTEFPWNDIVQTSVGASTGLSLASDVSYWEQQRSQTPEGSKLLHYFSPEITLSLPQLPQWSAVFRFHHRSGAYGLFGDVEGGAHYGVAGLRFTW